MILRHFKGLLLRNSDWRNLPPTSPAASVGGLASMCLSWCPKTITRPKRVTFLGFDVVDSLLIVVGIALGGLLLLLPYDPTRPTSYVEPLPILEHAGTANPPIPLQKEGRTSI
jgi:hypothetical protein